MIRDALIFICGIWVGVIAGLFLAGSVRAGRCDDQEPTELDNEQPPRDRGLRM